MSVSKSECTGNGEIVLKVLLTVLIYICVEDVHHQCAKNYILNNKLSEMFWMMKSNELESKLTIPPAEQGMKCWDCEGVTDIGLYLGPP